MPSRSGIRLVLTAQTRRGKVSDVLGCCRSSGLSVEAMSESMSTHSGFTLPAAGCWLSLWLELYPGLWIFFAGFRIQQNVVLVSPLLSEQLR